MDLGGKRCRWRERSGPVPVTTRATDVDQFRLVDPILTYFLDRFWCWFVFRSIFFLC
ncbi:hypothetical protein HanIR_Chr16g0820081 [Helianthus annuus]|nr:hypothetical protein HanIR_Chr16g0820081 [Helianthus annuus]